MREMFLSKVGIAMKTCKMFHEARNQDTTASRFCAEYACLSLGNSLPFGVGGKRRNYGHRFLPCLTVERRSEGLDPCRRSCLIYLIT